MIPYLALPNAATGKWKWLDYICTTSWVLKSVRSCRVYIRDAIIENSTRGFACQEISGRGNSIIFQYENELFLSDDLFLVRTYLNSSALSILHQNPAKIGNQAKIRPEIKSLDMTVFASLVYIGPSKMFDSDHRLLVTNIDFPCSKKDLKAELCQEIYEEIWQLNQKRPLPV